MSIVEIIAKQTALMHPAPHLLADGSGASAQGLLVPRLLDQTALHGRDLQPLPHTCCISKGFSNEVLLVIVCILRVIWQVSNST